ncbi:MAG: type II secretion system secretin GspD [Candidatus Hydrogenedentes bacterium]|nr:type II secretion system secretin GspD [Candidatus Hydrogenedentota bacterium]
MFNKRILYQFGLALLIGLLLHPAWAQEEVIEDSAPAEVIEAEPVPEEHVEEMAEEAPLEEPPLEESPAEPTARPARTPRPVPPRGPRPGVPQPAGAAVPQPKVNNETLTGAIPEDSDFVSFNFVDQPLIEVIQQIGKLTGRNFDVDPSVNQGTVTLITHDRIPPEMAYEVLESILSTRGYSMVPNVDGHVIQIIPRADVKSSTKPPLQDGKDNIPEGFDVFSTHIVPVEFADAAELSNVLTQLGSADVEIQVYAPTNTLVITDTADGLRRIFKLLEEVDVTGFETELEIFTLEWTRAEVVATQLEQVLLDQQAGGRATAGAAGATRAPTPTRPTRTTTRATPGAAAPNIIGAREDVLRMVPDERLNSLIVMASTGMLDRVRSLIKRLDTPTPYESNNLHIYQLLNADAEQVEQALQPLIGTAPRRQSGGGGGGGGGGAGGAAGGAAAAGGGGSVSNPDVQPFEQEVQITRYDQTNSLLIVASPQDYKLLEAYIARLDVPQRQVYVEAMVLDVTMSDSYGLTVEAAGISGNDGFGLTSTENLTGLATAAAAATTAATGAGAFASALLGLGGGGGLTTGIFDDITVEVGGQEVSIPFVPVFLQAVETLTDLEVLSQPSLGTVDNEEASITVGQEVPFVTASNAGRQVDNDDDNVNTFSSGFTRIQREEVGVKLKVTPQISEGDNVLLDLEIEISDLDADQIGSVDILGPTTNKSLIQGRVLVKDGSTAVIAGLIRDSANRRRNQAPILGDIPLLGNLFKNKSSGRQKRNMVVLVTPHVVKERVDLERVTTHKLQQYQESNINELYEKGFFKKVKTKQDRRKTYRPTQERTEELTGQRSTDRFGRGDIER